MVGGDVLMIKNELKWGCAIHLLLTVKEILNAPRSAGLPREQSRGGQLALGPQLT